MFAQHPCGCPVDTSRYPYRCLTHAAPRETMPRLRRDGWYATNTCPFCGRVNPAGLACQYVETCSTCGVVSCAEHGMATYLTGRICPRIYASKRTKVGRALYASLAGLSRAHTETS
jgi:hypothetical protein